MNSAAARILDQLQTPDQIGRDLALLRTRLYRFSDDLRWYVLAETLEEHLLAGRQPQPATISAVRACLEQIRRNGKPPAFQLALASAENIDITVALAERAAYTWQQVPLATPPSMVVMIVGAPRSGTSDLFNLLAATGKFAYLTTASCWAWPVRNLHPPGRPSFTDVGHAVLKWTTNALGLSPALSCPVRQKTSGTGRCPFTSTSADTVMRSARKRSRATSVSSRQRCTPTSPACGAPCCYVEIAVQLLPHPPDRTTVGKRRQVHPHHPRPARGGRLDAPQPLRVHRKRPSA